MQAANPASLHAHVCVCACVRFLLFFVFNPRFQGRHSCGIRCVSCCPWVLVYVPKTSPPPPAPPRVATSSARCRRSRSERGTSRLPAGMPTPEEGHSGSARNTPRLVATANFTKTNGVAKQRGGMPGRGNMHDPTGRNYHRPCPCHANAGTCQCYTHELLTQAPTKRKSKKAPARQS